MSCNPAAPRLCALSGIAALQMLMNRIGLLDRTRLGANMAYSGSYSYSANPNRAPNVCTSRNDLLAHCLTSRVSS